MPGPFPAHHIYACPDHELKPSPGPYPPQVLTLFIKPLSLIIMSLSPPQVLTLFIKPLSLIITGVGLYAVYSVDLAMMHWCLIRVAWG